MNMFALPNDQMVFYYYFVPYQACFTTQNQEKIEKQPISTENIEDFEEFGEPESKINLTREDLQEIGYEKKKKQWTQSEDRLLLKLCQDQNARFQEISKKIPGRNAKMCYSRYRRLTNQVKQVWTEQENNKLKMMVEKYGEDWKQISQFFKKRNDKQLKDHYLNYLRPNLSKEDWSVEQDLKLIALINKYGKNWKLIQRSMPNRSRNQIKNRFFGRIKRLDEQKKKLQQTSHQ